MTFEPHLTQRIVAGAKRRVIPRSQWKARANDYSSRALAACATLPVAWQMAPDEWKALVPAPVLLNAIYVISAIAFAGWVGKFLTQPSNQPPEKDK